MVYFLPIIPAIDGGEGGAGSLLYILLYINLFFNGIPCVLTALALWRTALWQGIPRPWLALIPVADLWVLGNLSDRYNKQVWKNEKNMRKMLPLMGTGALAATLAVEAVDWLLPLLNLRSGVSMAVLLIFAYGAVAVWGMFLVTRTIALVEMYQGFARGRSEVYIVLSILCPPLIPFFISRCHW